MRNVGVRATSGSVFETCAAAAYAEMSEPPTVERRRVAELVGAFEPVRPTLRLARHAQRARVRLTREAREREARAVERVAAAARDARDRERLEVQQRIDRPAPRQTVELHARVRRSGSIAERRAERPRHLEDDRERLEVEVPGREMGARGVERAAGGREIGVADEAALAPDHGLSTEPERARTRARRAHLEIRLVGREARRHARRSAPSVALGAGAPNARASWSVICARTAPCSAPRPSRDRSETTHESRTRGPRRP